MRAAQEALTNIRRHSGAERVRLSLRVSQAAVHLTVEDDGQGFGSKAQEGFGLSAMRARTEAAGGRFGLGDGIDGRGATVKVRLPR
jgi:signal transduction histidine kinase